MDSISELDDCINTLEQLQLSLDFETSTVKRNTKISSPLSSRHTFIKPKNRQNHDKSNATCDNRGQDITVNMHCHDEMFQDDHRHRNTKDETLDIQSVSVYHPKLLLTTQIDSSPLPMYECDSSDFPEPPSPLMDSQDNIKKSFSVQAFQNQNSQKSNDTTPRKPTANSLKLSSRPLEEPFGNYPSQTNIHSISETVVRFFTSDKTTKAILINENMTVNNVIKILMEKHFWIPSSKSAVVEKVPSLKMERFFEEHEYLLSCINSWPSSCGNMIFFEPREEPYGLLESPKDYIGDSYPSALTDVDVIKNLFLPISEYQDHVYIKKNGENFWKRKLCFVDHFGIYSTDKKMSKSSVSPTMIMPFKNDVYLYTSTGGWTKQWDAPTPFGFAFKPYEVIDPKSERITMFCARDALSLKRWCSNLRLCKYKKKILDNYQHSQDRTNRCNTMLGSDTQINRPLPHIPCSPTKSK